MEPKHYRITVTAKVERVTGEFTDIHSLEAESKVGRFVEPDEVMHQCHQAIADVEAALAQQLSTTHHFNRHKHNPFDLPSDDGCLDDYDSSVR